MCGEGDNQLASTEFSFSVEFLLCGLYGLPLPQSNAFHPELLTAPPAFSVLPGTFTDKGYEIAAT
jgi:hypothetical protein